MEIVLQSSFAIDLHKTANELYIRAIEARRNAYSKKPTKKYDFQLPSLSRDSHEYWTNFDG